MQIWDQFFTFCRKGKKTLRGKHILDSFISLTLNKGAASYFLDGVALNHPRGPATRRSEVDFGILRLLIALDVEVLTGRAAHGSEPVLSSTMRSRPYRVSKLGLVGLRI